MHAENLWGLCCTKNHEHKRVVQNLKCGREVVKDLPYISIELQGKLR